VGGLFTDSGRADGLGYGYLGCWQKREKDGSVESGLIRENLALRGYTEAQIVASLQKLLAAGWRG
jgi:hypothetical protein